MKTKIAVILGAVLFIATVVFAQQQPPQPGGPPNHPHPPNPDPLAHLMFPPDLIMGHARQLGLTD